MAGVLDKIRRRRNFPFTLPNGEEIKIRTMTFGEKIRQDSLKEIEKKVGWFISCVLVEDDGGNVFTKNEGETDDDFAMRVALECDLDLPDVNAIKAKVDELDKPPSVKVLAKNSDETSMPA